MIVWDPSLAVGLDAIDEQHKAIIKLINELEAKREHNDPALAVETLRFLRDYLNNHFELESQLMLDVGYPDLENHREKHEMFANHVVFFEIEKEFGVLTDQMLEDILSFLRDWFLHHIATEDKALSVFVRAQAMSG